MHEPREYPGLNRRLLTELFRFNARLGPNRMLRGIDYVRCIELPIVAAELLGRAEEPLVYLDIGCGDSILPAFIATRSQFTVIALDKFDWVRAQAHYLHRLHHDELMAEGRFKLVEEDFLDTEALAPESADLVTAVSVLEHIDGSGDSRAVRKVFDLLRPGGRFLVSCPYNHDRPADYRVARSVYGEGPGAQGAFFQRHYGRWTLKERILDAAPFRCDAVFYAGHYESFNFAKHLYILPWPWKLGKALYNWAAPLYAPCFLRVSSEPPSDADPQMLTADTAFLFLSKPL